MTEEEKKAIEYFKSNAEFTKKLGKKWGFQEEIKNDEIILNLIQKQDTEINKLKKIIDLMSKSILNYDDQLEINYYKDKKHVKETFVEFALRLFKTIMKILDERDMLTKERDYYKERYLEFNNAFIEGGKKLTEE